MCAHQEHSRVACTTVINAERRPSQTPGSWRVGASPRQVPCQHGPPSKKSSPAAPPAAVEEWGGQLASMSAAALCCTRWPRPLSHRPIGRAMRTGLTRTTSTSGYNLGSCPAKIVHDATSRLKGLPTCLLAGAHAS
eukprot:scaffold382_cov380-Prasinococcus_capsulatus_cf.AAC.24